MNDVPITVIDVLLVEDDPGDVVITREAFDHHKLGNRLHVVDDGVEAIKSSAARTRTPTRRGPG